MTHLELLNHIKTGVHGGLSEWERQFLKACRSYLTNNRPLTTLMDRKLREIHSRQVEIARIKNALKGTA
jgi:hypothetical protein